MFVIIQDTNTTTKSRPHGDRNDSAPVYDTLGRCFCLWNRKQSAFDDIFPKNFFLPAPLGGDAGHPCVHVIWYNEYCGGVGRTGTAPSLQLGPLPSAPVGIYLQLGPLVRLLAYTPC